MTHQYQLTGLTCDGCTSKVKRLLSAVPNVQSVDINESREVATIQMSQHTTTAILKAALAEYPKYQIEEKQVIMPIDPVPDSEETERSWLETYKPILLIFAYITGATLLVAQGNFMDWMRYFMAGFFLVFSFFKLLNLRDFAESYAMYDIVAKRWRAWGFVYPFVELALGGAFLVNFQPALTNYVTLVVMGVSAVGVIQSVMSKRKIRCACLGAVFNLPMSTVTIIEDLLMVAMAGVMLLMVS